MSKPIRNQMARNRRGVVLGLVIFVGVVILLVGLAMISQSQGLLLGGVDSKQRIKAHIAAETQATLQIAAAMDKASLLYGNDMSLPGTSLAALPTGDGLKGVSVIEQTGMDAGQLAQEAITSGLYKGFTGLKLSYTVHATGYAPGGAKSKVDVELKMYQVPIFQFGVFYNGDLEICPGSQMTVIGPVHTNGNAYFRAPNSNPFTSLEFYGPVTVTGTLYHWNVGTAANTLLKYRNEPTVAATTNPGLTATISAATTSTVPVAVNNRMNVEWGADSMKLPIETPTPHDILMPATGSDPVGLSRQKFYNKATATSRWVNPGDGSGRPAWITGNGANNAHRVFWDRREQRWIRYWNFDVSKIPAGNNDSIFYIADLVDYGNDHGLAGVQTINAFRIINASVLPRNMSIASPNPIYVLGNFNVGPTPGCYDRSDPTPPAADYCNAMIASDAITLLSPKWLNYKRGSGLWKMRTAGYPGDTAGSLDQGSENLQWTMGPTFHEMMSGSPNDPMIKTAWGTPKSGDTACDSALGPFGKGHLVTDGTITFNGAIMTGNKPSLPAAHPPANSAGDNGVFESNYEGGWHNTIRFLEDLRWATVVFNGSFVCMWPAEARGLRQTGKIIATLDGGYYMPPARIWGFDSRFNNLSNMPPGTPFLATPPVTTWTELR